MSQKSLYTFFSCLFQVSFLWEAISIWQWHVSLPCTQLTNWLVRNFMSIILFQSIAQFTLSIASFSKQNLFLTNATVKACCYYHWWKPWIQWMLRKVIKLYLYQLQVVQMLQVEGHGAHGEICELLLCHYENNPQLLENLRFSNNTIFHISGQVNWHNCCIWGNQTQQKFSSLNKTLKLVVWCAISGTQLVGPFFFQK